MSQAPRLAPHDAELVDADARAIYERVAADHQLGKPWDTLPPEVQDVYRGHAANPYGDDRR